MPPIVTKRVHNLIFPIQKKIPQFLKLYTAQGGLHSMFFIFYFCMEIQINKLSSTTTTTTSSPLSLVEIQQGSALIGRELQSVDCFICHKEPAWACNGKASKITSTRLSSMKLQLVRF